MGLIERWTPPNEERVPINIHPEARDALVHALHHDPALRGVGYSEFVMRALAARGAVGDRDALVAQLRRARRWMLAAQAQATGGRRSTIDGHIRELDATLREHGGQ